MQDQLEQRLKELKTEFENGQKAMTDLDSKRANVQKSMLKISGAIQVLEEEIEKSIRSMESNDKQ